MLCVLTVILKVMYIPFWVFCFILLFFVLFVCKCVLFYCHRVTTQLHLTNISYIISYTVLPEKLTVPQLVKKFPEFYGTQSFITTFTHNLSLSLPKLIVLFCVLIVCKCVLYYCQRVATQLQLTNISISIF